MKRIELTKGKTALVDEETYQFLRLWKWHTSSDGYAIRGTRFKEDYINIFMHQVIMLMQYGRYDKNLLVDHINGNRLDNRIENLRLATGSENAYHRAKTSKYKGVCKRGNTYRAYISKDYKTYEKRFKTEIDAVKWYNKKSKELYGEFAYQNPV